MNVNFHSQNGDPIENINWKSTQKCIGLYLLENLFSQFRGLLSKLSFLKKVDMSIVF
jgi:hypothetical protein